MISIFEEILLMSEGPNGWTKDEKDEAIADYYTNKAVVTRSLGRKPTSKEDKRLSLMVARNAAVKRHNKLAQDADSSGDKAAAAEHRYKAERLAISAQKSLKPIQTKMNKADAKKQTMGFNSTPVGKITNGKRHRPIGFKTESALLDIEFK